MIHNLGRDNLDALRSLYRHRRRGIGTKVLRAMLERCWARRCYKVMLMSGMRRAEVHAFYESLGFDKDAKQAFVITSR